MKLFNQFLALTKMMELVDMLGLGSSSFSRVGVQVPFLVFSLNTTNFRVMSILSFYVKITIFKIYG